MLNSKLKSIRSLLIGSCLLFGSLAFAGSVSGGGGGTTSPNPATPEQVMSAFYGTQGHGAGLIVSWLNNQQKFFELLDEAGQKESPFYKIFTSDKTVAEVVKNTKIEVRMTKPCLDADGVEKDGSIYGSVPGSICISPYSMAPKLNENNVHEETMALVVHELTHLFGTTEDEAVKIQQYALWNFMKIDFIDVSVALKQMSTPDVGSPMAELLFNLKMASDNLDNIIPGGLEEITNSMVTLRENLNFNNHNLLFVSPHTISLLTVEFTRLEAVRDYLCMHDLKTNADWRLQCAQNLDKSFQGEAQVTARTFVSRRGGSDPKIYDATYDEVVIKNLQTSADAQGELKAVLDFFKALQLEVFKLYELDAYIFRTNP